MFRYYVFGGGGKNSMINSIKLDEYFKGLKYFFYLICFNWLYLFFLFF